MRGWRLAELIAGIIIFGFTGVALYQNSQPKPGRVIIDMRDVPTHVPPPGLR
jgi:hypothetical protein